MTLARTTTARLRTDALAVRKGRVADYLAQGQQSPTVIAGLLAGDGILNPLTNAPYSAATVRKDVVQEIIGRSTGANNFWYSNRFVYTIDRTRRDYRFWDLFRNGLAEGYELVGALANRITQLLSIYVAGDAPSYLMDDDEADEDSRKYTDSALAKFVTRNHALLLAMLGSYYGLGDQWVVVNPDGSLTIPSPDTVTPFYDPTDYRKLTEVQIRTSDLGITVWDIYRADQRILKIQRGSDIQLLTYANPIGRLPVVQFSNQRRENELFGRPVYEALLPHFFEYNVLFRKQLGGANVMGNPIPVLEGMENLTDTIAANTTTEPLQYTDPFGLRVTAPQVAFDTNGLLFVGKGGSAKFLAPPIGFSTDIRNVLTDLFTLCLWHTGIPEVLWGAAVQSNRATAEMQLPPFVRLVNALRVLVDGEGADEDGLIAPRGGMFQVVDLFLRMRHLTDPKILVAPVKSQWVTVSETEDVVRLNKVIYARGQNWVDNEEGLSLLNLVTDPAASVAKGAEEAEETAAAQALAAQEADFMTRVGADQVALNGAAHQNMNPGENGADNSKSSAVDKRMLPPLPGGGRRAKQPRTNKPVGETIRELATNGHKG